MNVLTVITTISLLFIPGFVVSLIFFSWEKIDWIERIALSFAFSVAIVPLVVFYTNLFGIPISLQTILVQVLGISVFSVLILLIKQWRKSS